MAMTACSLPMTGMRPWCLSTSLPSTGLAAYTRALAQCWQFTICGIR